MQVEMFVTKWRRLKLTDEDLQALEALIEKNPAAGPVVTGTGGLRKIRFAPPSWNTGKSGATRVCYVYVVRAKVCGLITVFAKNEQANLNAKEKAVVGGAIKALVESIERKG
jgi:hypothetical protein